MKYILKQDATKYIPTPNGVVIKTYLPKGLILELEEEKENPSEKNTYVNENIEKENIQECLHKQCPNCLGTGRKQNGEYCVHCISCPCPLHALTS